MSTNRDREMEALLRAESPPDHGPGFWDDVRAELDSDSARAVVSVNRYRPKVPWLLAAAAVLVIGAVVGFGALRDPSADVDVTTDPTIDDGEPEPTPDDSASTSVPDDAENGPLIRDGDPIDRGSGTVVGVSADGRWLYLTDAAGDGSAGCEGSLRRALYVEPIDGGDRQLAASADDLDATTISELHFDGAGRAATVVQCEGFDARIVAASVAEDGTLSGITELTLPEPECHDGTVDGITDIDYIARGELVAATTSWSSGDVGTDSGGQCRQLYSLPDTPSEPTPLDGEDIHLVEAGPDGQLFTASVDGEIALNGGVIHTVTGISDMALSPSGQSLAITNARDDIILHIEDSQIARQSVFAIAAFDVQLIADVDGVMRLDTGDQVALAALHPGGDDSLTTLASDDNISSWWLSPDGRRLFVTTIDGTGEHLVEQRLIR